LTPLDCEAHVEYRVLGPIEVVADGRRIAVGAGKQRALLALLLMNANTAVSVDRAVESLWNGQPPATATKVVQVLVSQLRKALAAGAGEHIVTVGGGYMLRVEPDHTDVDRFEDLLEAGRIELAGGRPHDAEETLSGALAVWRGEAYADVAYEDFARDEIARLNERRLDAIEERFEAMLADRRHADAVSGLEQEVARHPLRERLVALWMVALHRSGRRAEALAAYDQARRRLTDELGIEPGERLQRLHGAMLESDEPEASPIQLHAPPRRRAARLLVAAAALLVAAAAGLLVVDQRGGGSVGISTLPGDSVGLIDPSSGRIVAQYPVGQTPTMVVARGHVAWTVNTDSRTVSRVGPAGRRDDAVRGTPADLVLADGTIWVSYYTLSKNRIRFGVARYDPATLGSKGRIGLPRTGPGGVSPLAPLAFAGGLVWVGAPAGHLTAINPTNMQVAKTVKMPGLVRGLCADQNGLWALLDVGTLLRADPHTGAVRQQIPIDTPHALDVAADGRFVWVSDGITGNVWRIAPGPPVETTSFDVGDSAQHLAAVPGGVWTTSSVDGTVTRIDASTGHRTRVRVGNAPSGVAVSSAGVWASVGEGSSTALESGTNGGSIPVGNCEPPITAGKGVPDALIAVDESLDHRDLANFTGGIVHAAEQALREHRFRAGRFTVGMQLCNDAVGTAGGPDQQKCAANAGLYASTPRVVAVLGPFFSLCTDSELAILNRAPGGPVAMVSPANDWAGFTRTARGNDADEPGEHYPTGARNYLRVYPSDVVEARVDARVAQTLGVRRVLVTLNPKPDGWETTFASSFAAAARADGLSVVGPHVFHGDVRRTVERALRSGVGGLFLAGRFGDPELHAMAAARHLAGRRFPIMTWNQGLYNAPRYLNSMRAAQGMYISGGWYTSPVAQLPAAGQRFMSRYHRTPGQNPAFAPFSAQAMDLILAAIARSDGSRQSVLHELFTAQVRDGILGSFGFQGDGDMTSVPVEIYRFEPGTTQPLRPFEVLRATPG
jgi:DNA-binding SARP family transcriptional activator